MLFPILNLYFYQFPPYPVLLVHDINSPRDAESTLVKRSVLEITIRICDKLVRQ